MQYTLLTKTAGALSSFSRRYEVAKRVSCGRAAAAGTSEVLLLDDEPGDLHLALAVEGDHADGDVGVGPEAFLDLGDDLGPVGAAEEGQLPHVPVAVVVVAGAEDGVDLGDGLVAVLELDAGGPPVADHVVDLLGDLRVGEVGQEGHALVRHGALGVPGHDGLGGPQAR